MKRLLILFFALPFFVQGQIVSVQDSIGYLTFVNPLTQAKYAKIGSNTLLLRMGTTAAGTAPLKFTTQTAGLTVVEQGAMELIGNSLQFTQLAKRRGVAMTQGVVLADVSANNTVTETADLITAEHGANYLEVGKCEVITLVGTLSQRSSASAQLKFRIKYAGVVIDSVLTPATTAISAGSNYELRVYCTYRSIGSSGTVKVNSALHINGVASIPGIPVLATINTTTAQATTITAIWLEANASDLFTNSHGYV